MRLPTIAEIEAELQRRGIKYSDDQPRDDAGRWTDEGGGGGGESGGSGGDGGGESSHGIFIDNGPTAFLARLEIEQADLPASHHNGLEGVHFNEGSYIHSGTTDAFGTYDPATRRIDLASNAPDRGAYGGNISVYGGQTVIHEIGHHVHLAKLTDDAAAEWERISGNGENARISAYAGTCRGEHFSEAYRAYFGKDHRAKLKNLEPETYKFMASLNRAGSKKFLPEGQMFQGDWHARYGK